MGVCRVGLSCSLARLAILLATALFATGLILSSTISAAALPRWLTSWLTGALLPGLAALLPGLAAWLTAGRPLLGSLLGTGLLIWSTAASTLLGGLATLLSGLSIRWLLLPAVTRLLSLGGTAMLGWLAPLLVRRCLLAGRLCLGCVLAPSLVRWCLLATLLIRRTRRLAASLPWRVPTSPLLALFLPLEVSAEE